MSWYDVMLTPLGGVFIGGSDAGLHRVDFMSKTRGVRWFTDRLIGDTHAEPQRDSAAAAEAMRQLSDYFTGKRLDFDLPLAPRGTDFQREVWKALGTIRPGETQSYGEVAKVIGRPSASRAVGAANGRNPLAIVVPCHRVVGANGQLTGYAGGIERKRWLLKHESASLRVAAPAARRRSKVAQA